MRLFHYSCANEVVFISKHVLLSHVLLLHVTARDSLNKNF
jgi:hypothetical protein